MTGLSGIVPPGVVTGDNLLKLMTYCRDHQIALPAFNCTSSSTINAVLEAARGLRQDASLLPFIDLHQTVSYRVCVGGGGGGDS